MARHLKEVVQLCCPFLELSDIHSICLSSKPLLVECLDVSDKELQLWLSKAVAKAAKVLELLDHCQLQPEEYWKQKQEQLEPVKWLLKQSCRILGIIPLAKRLDLLGALAKAEGDPDLCTLLINTGARITGSSSCNLRVSRENPSSAPVIWMVISKQLLKLSLDVPPLITCICAGEDLSQDMEQLQGMHPKALYKLTALSLASQQFSAAAVLLSSKKLNAHRRRWSSNEVYSLVLRMTTPFIKGSNRYQKKVPGEECFYMLLEEQGGENMGVSSFMKLLEAAVLCGWDISDALGELGGPLTLQEMVRLYKLALLGPRPARSIRSLAEVQGTSYAEAVLPYSQLEQLLQLAIKQGCGVAVDHFLSLPAARCLDIGAVQQLMVLTLSADPADPKHMDCWRRLVLFAAPPLLSSMEVLQQTLSLSSSSSSSTNSGCCCGNASQCYTCNLLDCLVASAEYEDSVGVALLLQLHDVALHHPAMLAAVGNLLASFDHDADAMQQILTALLTARVVNMDHSFWSALLKQPSAQKLPVEAVGEVLGIALDARLVGPLAHLLGELPVVQEIPGEVAQRLIKRCLPGDGWRLLRLLEKHVPAVQGLSVEGLSEVIMGAVANEAGCCAARLLALLRGKAAEVPVFVREALLPLLAEWKCPHQCGGNQSGEGVVEEGSKGTVSMQCLACELLSECGEALPSEVLVKTLVGAAKLGHEVMHMGQLCKFQGPQQLGEEQVMAVLLSVLSQQRASKHVKRVKLAQIGNLVGSSRMQKLSQAAVMKLEEVAAAAAFFIGGDMDALRQLVKGGGPV